MKESDFRRYPFHVFAAKYNGQELWLPFYAHALDVAGIIERLLYHWLPVHIIDFLSERNPNVPLDSFCRFLALVHDIGKMSPIFQAKICERAPYLKERIAISGIEVQRVQNFVAPTKTPHSFAGESILLNMGCPAGIAAIVGSHHGIPCSVGCNPQEFLIYEENFFGRCGENSGQGQCWKSFWLQWLELSLRYSGYYDIDELVDVDVPTQIILSGLLMMADWISSNVKYAPLISLEETGQSLNYPERIDQIWENVHLPDQWMPLAWLMDDTAFKDKYGFPPNEMQRTMIRIVEETTSPGIYILEAQMGTGKTEAALSAAEILASKWHCEGVFFGLPTQATANGLFPRLEAWAEEQSEEVQLSIKLAHGMATLQKDYRELFEGKANQNEDEDQQGLVVHSWFEGRKQALLASFVIGTVDQLLMMALQQKHVMFRHLGLAGKVVIVDECHAYDAYMSCYLERALEWLGLYEVPVILLSATLPAKRRAKLVEAYHGKPFAEVPEGWEGNYAYPLLTYSDGDIVYQTIIPAVSSSKKVQIYRREEEDIIDILKSRLADGGSAGIIVNTVAKAQQIAKTVKEYMPDYSFLLIHARYTMADRQKLEETLLQRLGKKSLPEMRNIIVVGTQILEQSLDIDFDFLITELAPMDLLLQRIGRLHRHVRKRPRRLLKAECIVFGCADLDGGSKRIYGEWLLRRTEKLLPDVFLLPDDISPMVQEVYRDLSDNDEHYILWKQEMNRQKIKESKAKSHRIVKEKELWDTMHGLLDANVSDRETDALARVRDGESEISVLLMVHRKDGRIGFLPWQSKGETLSADHVPSEEECCKILLQKVRLPRQLSVYQFSECVAELEQQNRDYLEEWQRSKWLQGELVLLLSEDLTMDLCGCHISYKREIGLICEEG